MASRINLSRYGSIQNEEDIAKNILAMIDEIIYEVPQLSTYNYQYVEHFEDFIYYNLIKLFALYFEDDSIKRVLLGKKSLDVDFFVYSEEHVTEKYIKKISKNIIGEINDTFTYYSYDLGNNVYDTKFILKYKSKFSKNVKIIILVIT